jgi:predicted MPP superfamily phosphohydrolase
LWFYVLVVLSIAGIHLYLWQRLVDDVLRPGLVHRAGTVVMVFLGVTMPITLFGIRNVPGYIWVALMFYLLVTLAVLEMPRYFLLRRWNLPNPPPGAALVRKWRARSRTPESGEAAELKPAADVEAGPTTVAASEASAPVETVHGGLDRRLLLARGTAIFAGLTAAGITTYGVRTAAGAPRIDRFTMPMAKLPRRMDGTRLAVVSDIHIGPTTGVAHAERVARVINSVNADVVCVVGDMVDGTVAQLGPLVAPLRNLRSRWGTYFVTGNHEYYTDYSEWISEVAEMGMRALRNERVEIEGLYLAGVNDLDGEDHGDPADFGRALGDRDMTRPIVLMAHQPVAAEEAAPFGVDLQVSGHTHGGQMVPFNLLVRLSQPVVSGFGNVDGVPVYVTNGAGSWGPPVRVGAPPQVTVIELRTTN